MLHPDKANGQQAHDSTLVPVILRALFLGLFLGVLSLPDPAIAETTVLREARLWDHGKYTRVVFEFSAPVQYQLSENATDGIVSLRFLETTSELPGTPVLDTPDCIDTMSTLQDGSNAIANISFNPKGVKLNPFTIQEPDRVVLDVFCEDESVATAALPEPRNIAPAPISAAAEPVPDKQEVTRPLVKQAPVFKDSSPEKNFSQKYLLLLLAAITGIIVLVIALIIVQKRGLSENNVAGNLDATRDTDDMMHAIDRKIKEKLMKDDE